MSKLEIAGLISFIGFVIGMISMIVTCLLKLRIENSKVLDFFLKISIIIYGTFGFTAIILSFIGEMLK